ncbi:MAG: hypothetical protein DMG49_10300 [Acidobacteria bacterium]|nr:MAG: hypothetical protein DMG49_10300 [Acidobacteriota bacterium]
MARKNRTSVEPRENKPIAGGVALVTGGSRGIGRAIAYRLAMLGASVSVCGRDHATLEESTRGMASIGVPVHTQIADVTKPAEVTDLTTLASVYSARPTKKPRPIGIACWTPILRASSCSLALWCLP